MFSKNPPSKPSTKSVEPPKKQQNPMIRSGASVPSIFSRDLVITGDIATEGDIQIEGRVEGNIKATTLTIGEQGAVNGSIKAGTVNIHGKVTGKIDATTIEMMNTANVLADLKQDHLTIANGAFFDGKCTRKTKPTTAPKPAKAK